MTEFTFFELHFEAGSIPAVGGFEPNESDAEPDGTGELNDGDDAQSSGVGAGALVFGMVVLALGIALARKLLAGEADDRGE